MSKTLFDVLVACFVLAICCVASAKPFATGPYLGQTPPGSTAQVFAAGLISDTRPHQWESHGTFSTDDKTFCFARGRGVFITENTDQGWTAPELIRSIPANTYTTWSPYLSPDANSIYFVRYIQESKSNLYRCDRTAHGWAAPQELGPPLSSPAAEWGFSLAANNSLYIASTRKGGRGGDVWYVPFVDNTWSRLVKLPPVGTFPGIAPDESFMVFTANRPGTRDTTETDLYLTLRRPDGTWSKPRNMGPRINSRSFEFGARISPDKKYLFFTRSNGWFENPNRDTADIYWVALEEYLPETHRQQD